MNCAQLFTTIGFKCRPLQQPGGDVVHCISTPFEYFDGDGIHVFAEEAGKTIRFFDGGDTMFHIAGSGIKFRDNRSLSPLRRLAREAGAELSDDGEISAVAMASNAQDAFRNVVTAILEIAGWEAENAGMTTDATTLANEVEFYLRQWKPKLDLLRDQPMTGISGRSHDFHFLLDGELIDVVSSKPQSTAAEVRKLADVRGIPSNAAADIRVIIDDREDSKRAQQEALILSRFADVWMLSSLQGQVAPPSSIMS
ncbi:Phage protein [Caballeronia glathei]|uniref:DUF1828 domain-containing protein n=1 Tax=Caballeronia glathei TaxID=60547 RepID=A0A069PLP1_9BURK|nr:DUF1828 domain-containing protein [Caballeronia glathei]KDR41603.1 hypothetical protein BG61_16950 [Caballeronia glathei]CDY79438.1 Phage protein [Caballeronia glathei]